MKIEQMHGHTKQEGVDNTLSFVWRSLRMVSFRLDAVHGEVLSKLVRLGNRWTVDKNRTLHMTSIIKAVA